MIDGYVTDRSFYFPVGQYNEQQRHQREEVGIDMNERKQQLIEEGLKLFAQKGYHATSIQQIADRAGVSKGAFYIHFDSKEDLTLSIYKHYYERLLKKVESVTDDNDPPKERLIKQMEIFNQSMMEDKEFIIMHLRENISFSSEVDAFLLQMKAQSFSWAKENLTGLFDKRIEPFIVDGAILMEGIMQGYFKWLIIDDLDVDPRRLAEFMVERMMDAVEGMLKKESHPMIAMDQLRNHFPTLEKQDPNNQVKQILATMRKKIDEAEMPTKKREDLHATIDLLLNEIKKDQPQHILFQGMLAHFKGHPALKKDCEQIANYLNIELI
ncbi:TetR/AcrR family transcriptional regulator [Thalassobacillus hwangdonensis]|uniref:TetR/AcrR family transcriptional regulator n=1 Tax=Thalassobacillus hwangdonensis TaxID=546108 RepID=A0ABW3L3X7_9BACI